MIVVHRFTAAEFPHALTSILRGVSTTGGPGCAPTRPAIRVPTPWRQVPVPLFAPILAGTFGAVNDRDPVFPLRWRLPNPRLGSQLAFKSHSAPRPLQTPAASS
jgi:hypothetical protein